MRWQPLTLTAALIGGVVLAPITAHAKIYLSVEQAQQKVFPGVKLVKTPVVFSDEQAKAIRAASGVRELISGEQVWRAANGAVFMVQEVVGKHEMVTYAIGINPDGTVKHIEIMEYVESYGYEVAEQNWLQQFYGKGLAANLRLGQGVANISGATLSCKHLSDGVRRDLMAYETVLKHLK